MAYATITFTFSSQVLELCYGLEETTFETAYRKAGADLTTLVPKGQVDIWALEENFETQE